MLELSRRDALHETLEMHLDQFAEDWGLDLSGEYNEPQGDSDWENFLAWLDSVRQGPPLEWGSPVG